MSRNRYYYYDHEACDFVAVKPTKSKLAIRAAALGAIAFVLAGMMSWATDRFVQTPQELALSAENEVLQQQLVGITERMNDVQVKLNQLSDADRDLYRTLLQADPISEDVMRVGVGGADPYSEFGRFSEETSSILVRSANTIDLLERRLNLQGSSYRELASIAQNHELQLSEMPAILPADGPVVSGFGNRLHPILKYTRPHNGIDILVPTGSSVVSPGDGVIKEAGRGGGLGNYVRIFHTSTGYLTTFAHLSEIPERIKPGLEVKRGEVIGLSGNTGLSKAPHLHYEVRDRKNKAYNPVYFFAPSMTPQQYQKMLSDSERGTMSLD